ncbi:MAG: DMT family transporter [Firmicutes bacterium]|nr:DMT family transporter [Bacillota bacterium]
MPRVHSRKPLLGILAVIGANLIWSGSFPATTIALAGCPASLLALIRLFIGAALLCPTLFRGTLLWRRATIVQAALLGVVGFTLPVYLETQGIGSSTPAVGAVLIALEPICTAVIAAVALRERLPRRRVVALALAFFGAYLIAGLPRPGDPGYAVGDLLMTGAVICYALYNVLSKRLLVHIEAVQAAAITLLGGCAGGFVVWGLRGAPGLGRMDGMTWAAVLYLAILSTAVAYYLWLFALNRFAASRVTLFLYMQPIAGVLLSFLIVGTRPGRLFFVGGALILAGLYISERLG